MTYEVGHVVGALPPTLITSIMTTARDRMTPDNRQRAVRANHGG